MNDIVKLPYTIWEPEAYLGSAGNSRSSVVEADVILAMRQLLRDTWKNPYWQHFCGEVYFQYKLPFDPSDFVHFRHRIGPEGMNKIFKQSIDLFDKDVGTIRAKNKLQDTFSADYRNIRQVKISGNYASHQIHCYSVLNQ